MGMKQLRRANGNYYVYTPQVKSHNKNYSGDFFPLTPQKIAMPFGSGRRQYFASTI